MSFNIGKIYGKVLDKTTKKPLAYASITVYQNFKGKDSLINGAFSLENGDFSVEGLPLGKFKVKASFLGYTDIEQTAVLSMPDNLEVDLGNWYMTEEETRTKEVEITAEKSNVYIGIDKRVYNVDKNITAQGGTAEDILRSVPSVTVDGDGNAVLRNSGATVYVDGRPTQLTLNQIPADMIEQVEVMTNPSAKYEAAMTGGMINIVMKKNRKPGYNGFVSLTGGLPGTRLNSTLNLNIKQGKWNFSGFWNYNYNNYPTEGYTRRTTLDSAGNPISYFDQNNTPNFRNRMQVGRISAEYALNNRNSLTFAGNLWGGMFNVTDTQSFELMLADKIVYEYGNRSIVPKNENAIYSGQLMWKKTFPKKGKELTTDITYGFGGGTTYSDWITRNYDPVTGIKPFNPEFQYIRGGSQGQQITFQTDFVNPINDSTRLELGVRSFTDLRRQDMIVTYKAGESGLPYDIPALSQDFDISNFINAAYINYASRWKGIDYQAGLRYEQTNFIGKSMLPGNDTTFGYNFPKDPKGIWKGLFPALYLSKKFSAASELQLNYTRKINRPGMMQIMPIIFMADRQNVRMGNPLLQPEFINTWELNYNHILKNINFLSSVYYRLEENPIVNYIYLIDTTDVLVNTFTNGSSVSKYGTDNTIKTQIGKSTEIMVNVNVFYNKIIAQGFPTRQGWQSNAKVNINYRFPDAWAIKLKPGVPIKFSTQFTGNWESRQLIPQGYRKGFPVGDIAFKAELSKLASLTFSVNDITNSRKMVWVYDMPGYQQEMMRRRDVRNFKIGLQFMFGKPDASIFKRSKNMQKMRDQNQGGMDMY